MRRFILGLMLVLGLSFSGVTAGSAAAATVGGGQHAIAANGAVHKVQYAGYCEELRRACIYKRERGEWGQGNCHRYRVECGRTRYCEQLRQACRYKEERGEWGQGNCRRYRHECG
jgi:hypothetical protein